LCAGQALGFIDRHGCRHTQAHRSSGPAGSSSDEQCSPANQQVRSEFSKVFAQKRLYHQAKQGERALSIAALDVSHFTEGGELYPGAKIQSKTHVQGCVRNPAKSVKGYFRPLVED
jgi:hypothetical protein